MNQYKALVSMCDYYLGQVLDKMDEHDLWKDTMLVVNTDHGFLLGEHEWWGKSAMPHYNEVAHIPFFVWNPMVGKAGERRQSLVQTIDLAPTLLTWFGLEPTKDMMGHDLTPVLENDTPVREFALFGTHGEYVNMTDGRYAYMRCPDTNVRQYEYTLMPTHMRTRFSAEELKNLTLAEPFSFTKEVPVLKIPCGPTMGINLDAFGTVLYDLETDPGQRRPVNDLEKEVEFINRLRLLMAENDAPEEAFAAMGFSREEPYTLEELRAEKERAAHPVLTGFEEYTVTKEAYVALRSIFRLMPKKQGEQMQAGLKQMLKASGVKEIGSETVVAFVESLPIPKEHKNMLLGMIG